MKEKYHPVEMRSSKDSLEEENADLRIKNIYYAAIIKKLYKGLSFFKDEFKHRERIERLDKDQS